MACLEPRGAIDDDDDEDDEEECDEEVVVGRSLSS